MSVTPPEEDRRAAWEMFAPPLVPPAESGLPRKLAALIAAEWWDCDPYLAAALMWEAYAAILPPEPVVSQVSTGVQSVSYSTPGGAMARAAWFRSLAGTLVSVPLALAELRVPDGWPVDWWQRNLEDPP